MNKNNHMQCKKNGDRRSVDHANQIMSLKDANLHTDNPGEYEAQDAHQAKGKPREEE